MPKLKDLNILHIQDGERKNMGPSAFIGEFTKKIETVTEKVSP